MRRLSLLLVTLALLPIVLVSAASAASTVTLAWDYGTAPADLAGFRIYYASAPGVAAIPANKAADVGPTMRKVTTANLPDGKACFVATAYDVKGNESAKSNEVCTDLDTTPPPAPGNIRIDIVIKVDTGS